jgi:hypothetical protein
MQTVFDKAGKITLHHERVTTMFEICMLFGFALAAFSQLLPAENDTTAENSAAKDDQPGVEARIRCDWPISRDRAVRNCSPGIGRQRRTDTRQHILRP